MPEERNHQNKDARIKDGRVITANRGEWSELYTFLKLLSQGRVYAADDRGGRIDGVYYPILKVIREEMEGTPIEYVVRDEYVDIEENGTLTGSTPRSEMGEMSERLLEGIRQGGGRAFALEDVQEYANGIRVTRLKASSRTTTDILVELYDRYRPRSMGFSIKSYIGKPPTLLNATRATNFIFRIDGVSPALANDINALTESPKIRRRLEGIRELGGSVSFLKAASDTFADNMRIVDTAMPEIMAHLLLIFYGEGIRGCREAVTRLSELDPLGFSRPIMYESKIKRFLADSALGMKPATEWNAENEARGGYMIVKDSGEVLAYTLYDMDAFRQYLFDSTRFEQGDTGRHGFGSVYVEGGELFIKLNLQIRFCE